MYRILFVISITLLFAQGLRANQPPCQVWNYDTEQCETFAEQNLTVNPDWVEFH